MKRFRVLLLVVGVCAILGGVFDVVTGRAEAGGGDGLGAAVSGNGDVNGDAAIDLSDPVYLLSWLFLGGPSPVPCPEPPDLLEEIERLEDEVERLEGELDASEALRAGFEANLAVCEEALSATQSTLRDCQAGLCEACPSPTPGLPDTGQTRCYAVNGNIVNCASGTCAGQDGAYATGCGRAGRFVDNGDDTVTDNCTGLMWQKRTASVNRQRWCAALAYCENLNLAGYDDWRLPNVRELQSLLDIGRTGPAIDPVFVANSAAYWSSSSVSLAGSLFPWWIDFRFGVTDAGDVDGSGLAYIRAVRSTR